MVGGCESDPTRLCERLEGTSTCCLRDGSTARIRAISARRRPGDRRPARPALAPRASGCGSSPPIRTLTEAEVERLTEHTATPTTWRWWPNGEDS